MRLNFIHPLTLALAGLVQLTVPALKADVVTDWNWTTIKATKGLLTPAQAAQNTNIASRGAAIEAIAVYDAVNAVLHFGTPYHYNTPAAAPASPEAAAAQAAHDVLISLFPAQTADLDARLSTSLAAVADGAAKTNGIAAGSASAADILALRASDGSSPNVTYPGPASPGVGEWRPTPGTLAAPFTFPQGINQQWATLTPFLLTSPSQFRPAPPPAVGSARYTKALNEVKVLGNPNSPRHTAVHTEIANFYRTDSEILVNEAARQLSSSHSLTLAENSLLFVTLGIAIADTRIAEWDAKYFYKFWRPVTSLNADPSGAVTNNYAAWGPTLVTPSHPSYPSGHSGTVVGLEVLRSYFGDFNTLTLHFGADGSGATRTVTSLTQAEFENGLSRIYGGIHYAFDNEAGQKLGDDVSAYVLSQGPHLLP